MESDRFDAFVQRLTAIRLTRGGMLRGLAAGAVAASGVVGTAASAAAQRPRDHHRHKKEICHCADPAAACTTEKVGRKQRKQHLKQDQCDYLGPCQGTLNPCAGAGSNITVDFTLLGQPCTVGGNECGDSATTGLTCVANVCVPNDVATPTICTADNDCSSGRCTAGLCLLCPETSICGTGASAQCCVVDATCIRGLCVLPVTG